MLATKPSGVCGPSCAAAVLAVAGCYTSEYVGHLVGVKQAPLMNISRLRFLYYNQAYSIERARSELGYAPRYTIRDGLPPTLDWFAARTAPPAVGAVAV